MISVVLLGDRLAAADYNSLEYLALDDGAARLGALVCPLNYLCAPDELRYVLTDLIWRPSSSVTFADAVFDAYRKPRGGCASKTGAG